MAYSVEGSGRLLIGKQDLGKVEFHISVNDRGPLRDASGTVYASHDVLWQAFNADRTTLKLDDGQEVTVLIMNFNGGDSAHIEISGPPPTPNG